MLAPDSWLASFIHQTFKYPLYLSVQRMVSITVVSDEAADLIHSGMIHSGMIDLCVYTETVETYCRMETGTIVHC
jgi:predicted solute-binding protein